MIKQEKLDAIKENVLFFSKNGDIPLSLGLQLILLFDYIQMLQEQNERLKEKSLWILN